MPYPVNCDNCKKIFNVTPFRYKRNKRFFCCMNCRVEHEKRTGFFIGAKNPAWKGEYETKICKVCSKSFKIQKYWSNMYSTCSKECRTILWRNAMIKEKNPRWKGGKRKLICKNCGGPFYRDICQSDRKFCSQDCYWEYQQGKNHHRWLGGKSFEPYGLEFNRILRQKIRERDNYTCQLCKNPGKQVHHVDYNKKNNESENLITLCRPCHGKTMTNRSYWKKHLSSILLEKQNFSNSGNSSQENIVVRRRSIQLQIPYQLSE